MRLEVLQSRTLKKKSIIVISFHLLMNYIYVANNGSSIGLMHGG